MIQNSGTGFRFRSFFYFTVKKLTFLFFLLEMPLPGAILGTSNKNDLKTKFKEANCRKNETIQ